MGTNKIRSILLGAAAATASGAVFLPVSIASAQTSPALPDQSQSEEIGEIVVTAQRRNESMQKVPISMQAYTGDQLQNLGVKSSTDLSQFTPNVVISLPAGAGNQPVVSIRGIGLNDFNTNNAGPNGIYVDEIYLSAPSSQTFQAFDLERIEVLKGPQGTLYGRNTSGGAINFISNKPTDAFDAKAHLEYGSFQTFNGEVAIGGPITSNLSARLAGVFNHSRGYFHNALTGGHENGFKNGAARLQLLWQPSIDLKLLFGITGGFVDNRSTQYRHMGSYEPGTEAGTPVMCSVEDVYGGRCVDLFGYGTPSGFYDGAYDRREHLKVDNVSPFLRADYTSGDLTFTSITSYQYNKKFHPEDTDASPNRLGTLNFGSRSNSITQELRGSYTSDQVTAVIGSYYLHEKLTQDQPLSLLLDIDAIYGAGVGDGLAYIQYTNNKQITDSYALYGQVDYSLTDALKLTLGGRYTKERKKFDYHGSVQFQECGIDCFGPITPTVTLDGLRLKDSAFSWRAALDYKFTPDVLAYASIATGFKSGGFNGGFLSLDPVELDRQLQPIEPESVTAYEVGLKSSWWGGRARLNIAAFYNDYKDLQVFALANGNSVASINVLENARKAHTQGIDAELQVKPVRNLTAVLNLGLLSTELDKYVANLSPGAPDYSGNRLTFSPKTSFSGVLDYKLPLASGASIGFQFSANYRSRQYFDVSNDPYVVQKGYWLGNARIGYQSANGQWELAGYVRNLSDKKYFVTAYNLAGLGFVQGITGTPRTFGVELNFNY